MVEVDPDDLALLIEDWENSTPSVTDRVLLLRIDEAVDRLREACGRG